MLIDYFIVKWRLMDLKVKMRNFFFSFFLQYVDFSSVCWLFFVLLFVGFSWISNFCYLKVFASSSLFSFIENQLLHTHTQTHTHTHTYGIYLTVQISLKYYEDEANNNIRQIFKIDKKSQQQIDSFFFSFPVDVTSACIENKNLFFCLFCIEKYIHFIIRPTKLKLLSHFSLSLSRSPSQWISHCVIESVSERITDCLAA